MSRILNIIHAADFHLDSPFEALPPAKAAQRRREQRDMLVRLSQLVREREADLVLLPGDLLDAGKTFYETIEILMRTLSQMDTQVFIAPGNHDFYGPHSPYARLAWPDNVHIFRTNQIERVPLPALDCVVYGAAFTGPVCEGSLLESFSAPRDDQLHIMVLHGEVGPPGGRYNTIPRAQIERSGLHYLALGHVHTFSGIQNAGGTHWAFPGCPEGRGFDETGVKGIIAGRIGRDQAALDHMPFCKRQYEILTVDLTDSVPKEALLAALPDDREADIFRIRLVGQVDEPGLELRELTELVGERFYHAVLQDFTQIKQDIWGRLGADTLVGLFLAAMRAKMEQAEEQEKGLLEEAIQFGLAGLEGREDPGDRVREEWAP